MRISGVRFSHWAPKNIKVRDFIWYSINKYKERYTIMSRPKVHPHTYNCAVCGAESIYRVSKRNIYCSVTCQNRDRHNKFISSWLNGETTGSGVNGASSYIKRHILELQSNKCAKCGIVDYNNAPIVLELEHKDGNSENNLLSNLECLCPNCHSQTPTYKNRNQGNGRHARRTRYAAGKSF